MTSLRLDSVQVNAIVHSITNMKLQSMCRSKTQLDTFMAGDPLVSSRTFAQCLNENLDTDGLIQAFLENLKVEKMANMTAASSYGKHAVSILVNYHNIVAMKFPNSSRLLDDYHGT